MVNSLKQSKTVQALWVAIGSLATFAFSIVSAAVLSRILSKAEYGTYKQVMYVYNTLLVVFTLGLPKAYSYFLPKYDIKFGLCIVKKINRIFFIIGFIFSALLYLGANAISVVLNNPQLTLPLRFFAISPFFILPTMGIEGIMASYKKSDINAIYLFITRILLLVFVVGAVLFVKPTCNAAVIGFTIASIVNCFIGLYLKKIPFKGIIGENTTLSYREIFRFSLPLMIASIGGIAIKSADQFFVSRYCGTEVFADFANGSIDLPFVGMVLGAAATVLLPEFSRLLTKNANYSEIAEIWRTTAYRSALILFPLIIFCLFFSCELMVFLYGEQYYASYVYFSITMVVNLFMIAPYYPIIIALGSTDYYAKVHIIMSFFVWAFEYGSVFIFHSALAVAITSAVLHIVMIFVMTYYISKKLKSSLIELLPIKKLCILLLINSISCLVVYFFMQYYWPFNSLLIYLLVAFVLFSSVTFTFGKLIGINYFSAIDPIYQRLINNRK